MALLDFVKKKKNQAVGFLKENPTPVAYAKNKVTNYLKPAGEVRTRDIVREYPSAVKQSISSPLKTFASTPKATFADNYSWKENPIKKFAATVPQEIINTPVRAAQNIGQTGLDIQDMVRRKQFDKRKALQIVGRTGEQVLDALSMGKGKVALASGNQFLKGVKPLGQLMKEGWKQGLKTGMGYGAGYGVSQGVQDENATVGSVARNTAVGTLAGGVLGGVLGGGLPALGALPGSIRNSVKNRVNKPQVTDSIPAHYVSNGRKPVAVREGERPLFPQLPANERFSSGVKKTGYDEVVQSPTYSASTERLIPAQQKTNRAVPTISDWSREVRDAMPAPGMSIEDVSGGRPSTPSLPSGNRRMVRSQNPALGSDQKMPEITSEVEKITRRDSPAIPVSPVQESVSYPQNSTIPSVRQFALPSGNRPLALPGGGRQAPRTVLPQSKEVINLPDNSAILNPEVARKSVVDNLSGKLDAFERNLYGDSSVDIIGGKNGPNNYQNITRSIREKIAQAGETGLSSENGLIRNISRGLRGLMGGFGNTAERVAEQGKMKGGISNSQNIANDFQALGDVMLPDKLSREKVWALLDPELAGVKVDMTHLSPDEIKAVEVLRNASDIINDQNFAMGRISHETWMKGRDGKYITRAYTEYDLPPELSEAFQKGRGKLDLGSYKERSEVNDWKQENAIKDPFYLVAKRIQSTFSNKAITDFGSWVANKPGAVSNELRPGYTQLSDSPMWGDLSGKIVRHEILESMKGFYSDNKAIQGMFDLLNAYDRNPIRQTLKKTKTVYNPATRLGNQVSNRVFAIFNGINPAKFEYNMHSFAPQELAQNGKYARLLRSHGVIGTDMTKYELVRHLAGTDGEVGRLGKIDNAISDSYGAVDDKSKLAAFKYWLDKGKTIDEAITKVRNGFQDYSRVGMFYDMGSKLPVIGKPFIRFQSELGRVIKNSALENPLHLASLVGSIWLMGEFASKVSGETPEDKKTRESRFGTPVIPFTNIPLVFQTPYGEVNVARMFGMYETAGADTKNKNPIQRISKYLPVDVPTNKEDVLKMLGNDVMTGGIVSTITDTDFRGKSIADPNQSKFQPTTLTPGEQNINRLKYLGNNYNLPVINDVLGVKDAVMGEPDFYGRTKTPAQALSKMAGFKVEQFGPEQAKEQRIKDQSFDQYKKDDVKKNINAILKEQQSGKIDAETARKRIEAQQGGISSSDGSGKVINAAKAEGFDSRIVENPNGGFSYIATNGDFKTVTSRKKAEQAVAIQDFMDSEDEEMEFGGRYYTKDDTTESGYRSKTLESKKKDETTNDVTLSKEKMQSYKTDDDIDSWLKEADVLYKKYDKMLRAETDEVERLKIENDMKTLAEQFSKYKSYGGYTKPKKGKKVSISSVNDADFIVKKMNSDLKPLRAFGGSRTNLASIRKPGFKRPRFKSA